MTRQALDLDCSIACALDVIGEWRTLLVLRNLFHGMRTFEALHNDLGISTSVLSARLKTLCDEGILEKRPSPTDGRSHEYRLTEKGLDLYPILVSLSDWGEKWKPASKGARMILTERATGEPVAPVQVMSRSGRPLRPQDVTPVAGPGANAQFRALLDWRRGAEKA